MLGFADTIGIGGGVESGVTSPVFFPLSQQQQQQQPQQSTIPPSVNPVNASSSLNGGLATLGDSSELWQKLIQEQIQGLK